jgi:LytS/YehU family sensor histidine kinase
LRFFYRIKEIDSNFKETREQNLELRFPHPGYFTLEVHALNGDYQKSQVLRMYIYVEPYFYQTIWFKLLIVLFAALILLGTYLILLKAARRRAQIKHETENKMRNLELSAWRSTVNPHFLFNALNTMQGLFHNNDFEAVNQFIIEFSSVLRKTIDQSGRIMISIQEEVNYLKNYLEFEKVKRHGILDFNIQWDDDKILKWYIPSMLIQPVLENSLKHGIRQNGLGTLHVSFFLLDDKIRCVLHDNGDGFNEDDLNGENSKGLRLITDKIAIVEKLLKKNIHFSFQNRKNNQGEIIGTETIFLFPIITNIRQFPDIESQFKDPDPKV